MGDYKAIGTQFTQIYYQILDSDRTKLNALYVRLLGTCGFTLFP